MEAAFTAFDRVERWDHWPTLAVHHFYRRVWEAAAADPRYPALVHRVNRSWGTDDTGSIPEFG